MAVSTRLLTSAGHPELVVKEIEATDDYDLIVSNVNIRAAERLLIRRKLQRLPRTRGGLERLLQGRLGP